MISANSRLYSVVFNLIGHHYAREKKITCTPVTSHWSDLFRHQLTNYSKQWNLWNEFALPEERAKFYFHKILAVLYYSTIVLCTVEHTPFLPHNCPPIWWRDIEKSAKNKRTVGSFTTFSHQDSFPFCSLHSLIRRDLTRRTSRMALESVLARLRGLDLLVTIL